MVACALPGAFRILTLAQAPAVPINGGCFHFGNPRCSSDRQDHRNQMRPNAPRAARTGPLFDFRFPKRAGQPTSKIQLKARRCCLILMWMERRGEPDGDKSGPSRLNARGDSRNNSARFVCNGALRFHAAPGTHVRISTRRSVTGVRSLASIGRSQPGHRTIGGSSTRSCISQAPPSRCLSRQIDFLSASL